MVIGCCLQEQDHGERCDRDDGPEDDAQHQRLEAYLADYLYGEPSADQEQRGRKSAACGDRNAVRELGRQVAVGVYEHGNDEPEDEPGDLDLLAFLTEDQGRHQRQGDDPQGAGEFDGRGYLERLLAVLQLKGQLKSSNTNDPEAKEFEDFDKAGSVKLVGLPSKTLAKNYLLAIRALRYAANFDLPVNPHTWVSIIQSANRILDYVPAREIMEEWRKVAAESMWKFVQLLFEAQLLHGLMPEIAALSCIKQERNDDGDIESVFDHTIECMKRYPEEGFSMDWYGTLATMFHDVGKLYTAEHLNGRWTFYQHHRVGAGVTRKILRRLHFTSEDIDLICHLVRHHMMFHFMLTDRGIRRFKALPETERLIAMCRADIEARDGSYTYFNHNSKYLTRAETDELLLEPLLNGNEIMEYTSLPPGPAVGTIREALLKAQVAGEVTDRDSAIAFVKNYAAKLK